MYNHIFITIHYARTHTGLWNHLHTKHTLQNCFIVNCELFSLTIWQRIPLLWMLITESEGRWALALGPIAFLFLSISHSISFFSSPIPYPLFLSLSLSFFRLCKQRVHLNIVCTIMASVGGTGKLMWVRVDEVTSSSGRMLPFDRLMQGALDCHLTESFITSRVIEQRGRERERTKEWKEIKKDGIGENKMKEKREKIRKHV